MKRNLLFLLGGLFVLFIFIHNAKKGGDFNCFINAAKNLRDGINIYNPPLDKTFLQYYYSPLFAIFLVPFSYIPSFVICFIWLLFSGWCLHRTLKIASSYLDFSFFTTKETLWIFLLSLIFTFRTVFNNFGQVQMTIFLLWASIESIDLIRKQKVLQGSALLALAINIKILPLAIVAYLLYRKELKSVFYIFLFFIIYMLLPSLFLGIDKTMCLTIDWFHSINPVEDGKDILNEKTMHSINALIMPLFKNAPYQFPYRRYIVDLDLKTIHIITTGIQLLLVSSVLFFLKFPPFSKIKSNVYMLWEIGYIFLLTPLIFPHQQKYSFSYQIVPIFYLFYFLAIIKKGEYNIMSKKKFNIMITLILLCFILITLTSDLFIGRHLDDITQYFKLLTYGSIILLIPYAMANPKYICQFYKTKKNV
jgi:hypothetical protein